MLFIGKYAVSHENNYEDQSGLVNLSMEITSQPQHVILVGEKHTNLLNIHKIPISKIKIWQIFHVSSTIWPGGQATLLLIAFLRVFNFSSQTSPDQVRKWIARFVAEICFCNVTY